MRTWIDLTDNFPMRFDVETMRAEYESLKSENWLGHYDPTLSREWKAIMLVSIGGKMVDEESQRGSDDYSMMARTDIVEKLPYIKSILDAFKTRQGRVRILKLAPGAGIGLHRDIEHEAANFAVGQVRLHIPIYTNEGVTFFVGGERIKMQPGRLYYVNFSKPHFVRNDGDSDRIHLVLDLEVNDWLTAIFPKMGWFESLECKFYKVALPLQWKLVIFLRNLNTMFWKYYEGSSLQRIKHRLMPKF